jgi:hypothetical protein
MKKILCAAAALLATAPAFAAVSVTVGQPGFYGHLDIGSFPPPQVVYATPVVIQQAPVGVVRQPVYLRVPPGHAKNWRRYCHRYNACGQPVYFVQDNWYNSVYVPEYRNRHGHGNGRDEHHGNDRHDNDRGDDRDRDHGKGRDKH